MINDVFGCVCGLHGAQHRIFTRSVTGWPGVEHLGETDFSAVIRAAQKEKGFVEAGTPSKPLLVRPSLCNAGLCCALLCCAACALFGVLLCVAVWLCCCVLERAPLVGSQLFSCSCSTSALRRSMLPC